MKIKQGDVLVCGPEAGCGIKVVVIEACDESECDLKCCGKNMAPAQKQANPDAWKQHCEKTGSEDWQKHAKDRVGGGFTPPVLSHHRAYGSVPRRFMKHS